MAARLAPAITPDTEFFWNGLRENKLLIQRCGRCQAAAPSAPTDVPATAGRWIGRRSNRRAAARVYSYVMPHEPKFPFFDYPYVVALIELDEGVRIVSNLTDIDPADVEPGMPVEVYYRDFDGRAGAAPVPAGA